MECAIRSYSCRAGDSSERCVFEYRGHDESEFKLATSASVSRAEADIMGSGVVFSRVLLCDRWVE